MINEISVREIDRLSKATENANYISTEFPREFFQKALQCCDGDRGLTARYIFNLGRILERIDKSLGEDNENLPDICLDDVAAIIDVGWKKGHNSAAISNDLFDLMYAVQREAFRYGYYAALENEDVAM